MRQALTSPPRPNSDKSLEACKSTSTKNPESNRITVWAQKASFKLFIKQNSRDTYETFPTPLLLDNFSKDMMPILRFFSITFHHVGGGEDCMPTPEAANQRGA